VGEGHEGAQWWSCRCQQPYLLAPKESGQLWFTKSAEEPTSLRQCIIKPTGYARGKSVLGSARFFPYARPMYYIV